MEKNTFFLISKYRTPIMGIAALWILVFHVWHPVLGEYGNLGKVEMFIKNTGFCGVDIFLLVSALGLVYAAEKYDLLTFYKRRFWNVYPPFFLAALGIGFFRGWEISEIFRKVFFIGFFTESIYTYLWYVPGILLFYLAFPFYYNLFQKGKNKYIFTGLGIIIWYLLSMTLNGILRPDFYGLTNRIPVFLVGILIGWLSKNKSISFNGLMWIACVTMLLSGIYLMYLTNYKDMYLLVPTSNCCVPNFFTAISLSFILAQIFDFMEGKTVGKVLLKILSFFGSLSLPLYCIQEYLHTDITENPPTDNVLLLNSILFLCIILAGAGLQVVCKWMMKIPCVWRKWTEKKLNPSGDRKRG